MNIHEKIKLWEGNEGVALFEDLGLKSNSTILDYGCGFGHYSIAASRFLRGQGTVFAVDINKVCLDHISDMIEAEGLKNVKVSEGNVDYSLNYEDNLLDMILYYDIFHGRGDHRFIMLREAYRTLKYGGLLSVLPFHLSNFTDKDGKKKKYSYKKIIEEVSDYGFEIVDGQVREGIHFEKYHSPYFMKGGVEFENLEKAQILTFKKI